MQIRPLCQWFAPSTGLVVLVLLATHTTLLAWGAASHSPTYDEVGHLPAGISHWELGRFDLFRVNPPLVRMVAALPVVFTDAKTDWHSYDGSPTARSDFAVGQDFLAANGERTFWYFTIARWACIPFSVLGGLVCWMWARRLYGNVSGILALVLWCFCPSILGHGELITPDVGTTSLGLAAGYAFWRWLKSPGGWRAALTGILFGLLQLSKTTWIVLFVFWPVLWVFWKLTDGTIAVRREWMAQGGQLAAIFLIALCLLNLGFGYEGSFTRLGDFPFISATLGGDSRGSSTIAPHNRFANTWLCALPVPVPKNYVLGIDHQKRNFEEKFWAYLREEWQRGGWYHYYLYGMLIKVPLGTWMIGALAFVVSVAPPWLLLPRSELGDAHSTQAPTQATGVKERGTSHGPRNWFSEGGRWRDEIILLAPAILILYVVSSQTGINRHLRYVLPAFPFLFVWASKVGSYANFRWNEFHTTVRSFLGMLVLIALTWTAASSLYVYPHSLSYFNELVGGPHQGHWHLGVSNTDWGQDLFYMNAWYKTHSDARPFHLEYGLPLVDPHMLGIEYLPVPKGPVMNREGTPKTRNWPWEGVNRIRSSTSRALIAAGGPGPLPGWFAISVNEIHDLEGRYEYLLEFEPVASAGYSMKIYHVTLEKANRLRQKLGISPVPPDGRGPTN